MVNNREHSILNGQYALAIFLDIAGAFDNLDIGACMQGMTHEGLPPWIIDWYGHYLGHRTIAVDIKGLQSHRSLTRETPQGEYFLP